jgi:hypothetical protein
MTTQEAINILVGSMTLPNQIDRITPFLSDQMTKAKEHIESLPKQERETAEQEIYDIVNSYFAFIFTYTDFPF